MASHTYRARGELLVKPAGTDHLMECPPIGTLLRNIVQIQLPRARSAPENESRPRPFGCQACSNPAQCDGWQEDSARSCQFSCLDRSVPGEPSCQLPMCWLLTRARPA